MSDQGQSLHRACCQAGPQSPLWPENRPDFNA